MSTESLMSALRPWAWLLAVVVLVGAVAGYAAASLRAPQFEASTTVLVGPVLGEVDAQRAATEATATYAELATSDPALVAVGSEVGLSTEALRDAVTVTPNSETRLIDIQVRSTSSVGTAQIADAVAAQLVSLSVEGSPAAVGQVRVVAPASQTPEELPSNALLFGVLAAGVALVVAAALVLLFERSRQTVRTRSEAEELTGLPVLATVPDEGTRPGIDRSASAYRLLATHLEFRGERRGCQVVAVVGVRDDAADVAVAVNVARALAAAGSRVLLTDLGGGPGGAKGHRTVVHEPGPDGSLSEAGPEVDAQLAAGAAPAASLDALRRGMDFVVITLRPLSVSAESVNWLAASDTVLLVVEARRADAYQLATAAEAIQLTTPHLAGLVIVPATPRREAQWPGAGDSGGRRPTRARAGAPTTQQASQHQPRKLQAGQHHAAQHRSGQDRSGQDRSGQDRSGQDRSGQDRSGQEPGGATARSGSDDRPRASADQGRP